MIRHAARPGPDYWSWRCLLCGERVDYHTTWLKRMIHRWRWR